MANRVVLDTHSLIWYLERNPRLGAAAKSALSDPSNSLFLPAIALAEAWWMVEHGRTRIPSVAALLADVDADPRITFVPLRRSVLDRCADLPELKDMHDRQIVATALEISELLGEVWLVTRDEIISASGRVPILWHED